MEYKVRGSWRQYVGGLFLGLAFHSGSDVLYDACLRRGQERSRNGEALGILTAACERLYKDGDTISSEEQRYNICLLENLPGVEHGYAVRQIVKACSGQGLL
jgi:hypothetical protein